MIVDLNFICIYMMINNFTGQLYIGQTINFLKRINEHFRGYGSENQRIDRACLKYGREAFSFKPLEIFDEYDEDLLNEREIYWIEKYNTYHDPNHYNLTIGGNGVGAGENNPNFRHDIDTDILVEEYFDNGLSTLEIADKYNTGQKTVYNRLKEAGYELRTLSEAQSKYSNLWDISSVRYDKKNMFKHNREPNPCKCFRLKYNGKNIPIGLFFDFLTPEIIGDLINEFAEDD